MPQVMSVGQAARVLGCSPSMLRKLESLELVPRAQRIAGMDRRIYSAEDLEAVRQALEARRQSQQRQAVAAG